MIIGVILETASDKSQFEIFYFAQSGAKAVQ